MRFFRNIFRRGEREDNGRQELLHLMPKGGVCAELGVWKGDFSQRILDVTSPRELHLVDPWQFQPEFPHRWYGGSAASGQIDMDAICDAVTDRFSGLENVHIHRQSSAEWLGSIPESCLDWVYIDGNHSRDAVFNDLKLSWEKTKWGGYVTGDDYFWKDSDGTSSVSDGVRDFVDSIGGVPVQLVKGQYLLRKA